MLKVINEFGQIRTEKLRLGAQQAQPPPNEQLHLTRSLAQIYAEIAQRGETSKVGSIPVARY